jgi:hypothetical protein
MGFGADTGGRLPRRYGGKCRWCRANAAFLLALALATGSCVGSPPPPERDLFGAIEKSKADDAMFEFALAASLMATSRPASEGVSGGSPESRTSRADVFIEGSARPEKGYRALVSKRPVLWGEKENTADGAHAAGALVVEEIPGAVARPGTKLWFSGRSGAMDPFGPLAYALPPLGSPDSVFDRTAQLLRTLPEARSVGQAEVRSRQTDVYETGTVQLRVEPPKDARARLEAALASKRDTGSQANSADKASPTPSPTGYDGPTKYPLTEAAWLFANEPLDESEVTALASSEVTVTVSVIAYVDLVDGRLRRLASYLGVIGLKRSATIQAESDFWGFDPIGEFKPPIDTTFISPTDQESLLRLEFKPVAPAWLPPGMEFTGIEIPRDAVVGQKCRPIFLRFTGRGREGFIEISEAPRSCSSTFPSGSGDELTRTASGRMVAVASNEGRLRVTGSLRETGFELTAGSGVTLAEAVKVADSLEQLEVPIPLELSLPLPKEGPERR